MNKKVASLVAALILGKALSGGMYPVSAILADGEVMEDGARFDEEGPVCEAKDGVDDDDLPEQGQREHEHDGSRKPLPSS